MYWYRADIGVLIILMIAMSPFMAMKGIWKIILTLQQYSYSPFAVRCLTNFATS